MDVEADPRQGSRTLLKADLDALLSCTEHGLALRNLGD